MIETQDCYSGSYGYAGTCYRTLDRMSACSTMSVYCQCGRIVVLDRAGMKLRLSLGKELECMQCRNARISSEIDAMNNHFDGVEETDDWLL